MLLSILGLADQKVQLLQGLGLQPPLGRHAQQQQEEEHLVRFGEI